MKTFLVVNPRSANGETGRRWLELSAKIGRELGGFDHAFTQGPMDAARLCAQALKDGAECVVAVGGDGTINEVVNGFFEQDVCLNPKASLGVIPRGTGGDFRKTFGWDAELQSALRRLQSTTSSALDVGALQYTTPEGRSAHRYFANICSFGVGGLVDQEVNRRSKRLGGKVSFALGSLRALLKYRDQKVRLWVDERPPEELEITSVAVANGKYFGGGMKVAPDANPCDGLFDVTIWSGFGLRDFVIKSRSIYDGSHVNHPGTRRLRCQRVRAETDGEVLLDVDGEQPGKLPCQISIRPGAIRLRG
jgi:YegS/Rv2252/BmrU family lipid kinase